MFNPKILRLVAIALVGFGLVAKSTATNNDVGNNQIISLQKAKEMSLVFLKQQTDFIPVYSVSNNSENEPVVLPNPLVLVSETNTSYSAISTGNNYPLTYPSNSRRNYASSNATENDLAQDVIKVEAERLSDKKIRWKVTIKGDRDGQNRSPFWNFARPYYMLSISRGLTIDKMTIEDGRGTTIANLNGMGGWNTASRGTNTNGFQDGQDYSDFRLKRRFGALSIERQQNRPLSYNIEKHMANSIGYVDQQSTSGYDKTRIYTFETTLGQALPSHENVESEYAQDKFGTQKHDVELNGRVWVAVGVTSREGIGKTDERPVGVGIYNFSRITHIQVHEPRPDLTNFVPNIQWDDRIELCNEDKIKTPEGYAINLKDYPGIKLGFAPGHPNLNVDSGRFDATWQWGNKSGVIPGIFYTVKKCPPSPIVEGCINPQQFCTQKEPFIRAGREYVLVTLPKGSGVTGGNADFWFKPKDGEWTKKRSNQQVGGDKEFRYTYFKSTPFEEGDQIAVVRVTATGGTGSLSDFNTRGPRTVAYVGPANPPAADQEPPIADNAANRNNPTANTIFVRQGTTITDEMVRQHLSGVPSDATTNIGNKPATDSVGDKTPVPVEITYTDGSKESVRVPVRVFNDPVPNGEPSETENPTPITINPPTPHPANAGDRQVEVTPPTAGDYTHIVLTIPTENGGTHDIVLEKKGNDFTHNGQTLTKNGDKIVVPIPSSVNSGALYYDETSAEKNKIGATAYKKGATDQENIYSETQFANITKQTTEDPTLIIHPVIETASNVRITPPTNRSKNKLVVKFPKKDGTTYDIVYVRENGAWRLKLEDGRIGTPIPGDIYVDVHSDSDDFFKNKKIIVEVYDENGTKTDFETTILPDEVPKPIIGDFEVREGENNTIDFEFVIEKGKEFPYNIDVAVTWVDTNGNKSPRIIKMTYDSGKQKYVHCFDPVCRTKAEMNTGVTENPDGTKKVSITNIPVTYIREKGETPKGVYDDEGFNEDDIASEREEHDEIYEFDGGEYENTRQIGLIKLTPNSVVKVEIYNSKNRTETEKKVPSEDGEDNSDNGGGTDDNNGSGDDSGTTPGNGTDDGGTTTPPPAVPQPTIDNVYDTDENVKITPPTDNDVNKIKVDFPKKDGQPHTITLVKQPNGDWQVEGNNTPLTKEGEKIVVPVPTESDDFVPNKNVSVTSIVSKEGEQDRSSTPTNNQIIERSVPTPDAPSVNTGTPSIPVSFDTPEAGNEIPTIVVTIPTKDNTTPTKTITLTRTPDGNYTSSEGGTPITPTTENGKTKLEVPVTPNTLKKGGQVGIELKNGKKKTNSSTSVTNTPPRITKKQGETENISIDRKQSPPQNLEELKTFLTNKVTISDTEDDPHNEKVTTTNIVIKKNGTPITQFNPNDSGPYTAEISATDSDGDNSTTENFTITISGLTPPTIDPVKDTDENVKVTPPADPNVTTIEVDFPKKNGQTEKVVINKEGDNWKISGTNTPLTKDGEKIVVPVPENSDDFTTPRKVQVTGKNNDGTETTTTNETPITENPLPEPTTSEISTTATGVPVEFPTDGGDVPTIVISVETPATNGGNPTPKKTITLTKQPNGSYTGTDGGTPISITSTTEGGKTKLEVPVGSGTLAEGDKVKIQLQNGRKKNETETTVVNTPPTITLTENQFEDDANSNGGKVHKIEKGSQTPNDLPSLKKYIEDNLISVSDTEDKIKGGTTSVTISVTDVGGKELTSFTTSTENVVNVSVTATDTDGKSTPTPTTFTIKVSDNTPPAPAPIDNYRTGDSSIKVTPPTDEDLNHISVFFPPANENGTPIEVKVLRSSPMPDGTRKWLIEGNEVPTDENGKIIISVPNGAKLYEDPSPSDAAGQPNNKRIYTTTSDKGSFGSVPNTSEPHYSGRGMNDAPQIQKKPNTDKVYVELIPQDYQGTDKPKTPIDNTAIFNKTKEFVSVTDTEDDTDENKTPIAEIGKNGTTPKIYKKGETDTAVTEIPLTEAGTYKVVLVAKDSEGKYSTSGTTNQEAEVEIVVVSKTPVLDPIRHRDTSVKVTPPTNGDLDKIKINFPPTQPNGTPVVVTLTKNPNGTYTSDQGGDPIPVGEDGKISVPVPNGITLKPNDPVTTVGVDKGGSDSIPNEVNVTPSPLEKPTIDPISVNDKNIKITPPADTDPVKTIVITIKNPEGSTDQTPKKQITLTKNPDGTYTSSEGGKLTPDPQTGKISLPIPDGVTIEEGNVVEGNTNDGTTNSELDKVVVTNTPPTISLKKENETDPEPTTRIIKIEKGSNLTETDLLNKIKNGEGQNNPPLVEIADSEDDADNDENTIPTIEKTSGTYNLTEVGEYPIQVGSVDSKGKKSTSTVTITIKVIDTNPVGKPVIDPINVNDKNVKVTPPSDPDLVSVSITFPPAEPNGTPVVVTLTKNPDGTYTSDQGGDPISVQNGKVSVPVPNSVTLKEGMQVGGSATDGNSTPTQADKVVVTNEAPVITPQQEKPRFERGSSVTDTELLEAIKAKVNVTDKEDDADNDDTTSPRLTRIVSGGNINTNKRGNVPVTVEATDSKGKTSTRVVEVEIIDTTAPNPPTIDPINVGNKVIGVTPNPNDNDVEIIILSFPPKGGNTTPTEVAVKKEGNGYVLSTPEGEPILKDGNKIPVRKEGEKVFIPVPDNVTLDEGDRITSKVSDGVNISTTDDEPVTNEAPKITPKKDDNNQDKVITLEKKRKTDEPISDQDLITLIKTAVDVTDTEDDGDENDRTITTLTIVDRTPLNDKVVGTYNVTIRATDSKGKTTDKIVPIKVIDTTPPNPPILGKINANNKTISVTPNPNDDDVVTIVLEFPGTDKPSVVLNKDNQGNYVSNQGGTPLKPDANGTIVVPIPNGHIGKEGRVIARTQDDNTPEPNSSTDVESVPTSSCELTFYNWMSLYNDGSNDAFVIDGIVCYPENQLKVFTRWGRLIYEEQGYDNHKKVFKGYSADNKKVAPGVYYFIFEYKDVNGVLRTYTGWLYIKD